MLVNGPMTYKRPNFPLRLEKNLKRQTCRSTIDTVDIGRICLISQTQNKAGISIWGIEMFYVQISFDPQKITAECKLWCQSIYLTYVSRH